MPDEPSIEEIADGMALWEEHRPRTGDDWREVARRTLADGADTSNASPLFAAVVAAESALAREQQAREEAERELGHANERRRKLSAAWLAMEGRALAAEADAARYCGLLDQVDAHYSGSLDHQPAYVRAIRAALEEDPDAVS